MEPDKNKNAIDAQLESLRTRLEQLMVLECEAEARAIDALQDKLSRIEEVAEETAEAIDEMAAAGTLIGEGVAEGAKTRMFELRNLAEKLGEDVGLLARKDVARQAESVEKRIARLMRVQSQLSSLTGKKWAKAEALSKSKRVQDHVELILGAVDELPIDAALDLLKQASHRTGMRASAARSDGE